MTQPDGVAVPEEGATARSARPRRSARHQFASTILVLEAFVVFFATLAAFGLRVAEPSVVWLVGGSVALACLVVSGLLRVPGGYVAGSLVQVPVVALGYLLDVATMYLVGGLFVVLWVVALRLGGRIDRERAEREADAGGAGAAAADR